jgi:predicted metalloendopeptidase
MIPAFIKKSSRARIAMMVEALKKAFEKRIINLGWLDRQTKEQALKKLWAIGHNIGYPSSLANPTLGHKTYRNIKIHRLDFYRNLVNLRLDMNQKEIIGISGKRDRREWSISASAVNAYYDLRTNQIFVPAGILQSPTFATHQPSYLNYGAIGFIVGHELTHAFDVQGATRNAQGHLVNWWSNSTMARFSNKTQCMVDQYANYSLPFGNVTKNINGYVFFCKNVLTETKF